MILITAFGIEIGLNPLMMRAFPEAQPSEEALTGNQHVGILTFFYTFLCAIAGGYAAARLAGRHPNRHALALGLMAMMAFPGKSTIWGWIIAMVAVIPAAWCGGLIYGRRLK